MSGTVKSVPMSELSPLISAAVKAGDDVTLCVTGYSMLPLWRDRHSNVVLTACRPDELKKKDIPLYRRANGQYVLHRIVKVHPDCFDLAGDAQTYIEKGLPKDSVLAVAKGWYTERGKFVSCSSLRHRLYASVWTVLLPLRKYPILLYKKTVLRIKLHNDHRRALKSK